MSRKSLVLPLIAMCFAGIVWATWPNATASAGDSFVATEVETIYQAQDPVVAFSRTTTIAVRSDGSHAYLRHFVDPAGGVRTVTRRSITDLATREFLTVDPFSESISTYPLTAQDISFEETRFRGSCDGRADDKILGYDVLLREETKNVPGHTIDKRTTKAWVAPQLGCFPLYRESLFYSAGRLVQRTVWSVVSVKEGEPAAWIFERPDRYLERTPSEAAQESERRYPNHDCCRGRSVGSENLDKIYFEKRGQR